MPQEPEWRNGQMQLTLGPEEAPRQIEPQRLVYAVSELNEAIGGIFEANFRGVFVAGEISGCRQAPSGHYYFALKDSSSQIKCVLFKGTARFARCKPRDGLAVIARGSLEVYQARGEYQLIVEALEPQGAGALQIAFEQLKKKLEAEGLFAAGRKRALPRLPKRIGVITSQSGAVIRDILHVLERRFQGVHVRLFPALVQGEGSVEQVCAGLGFFSRSGWAEVVILARGGGSLEDLWTFNEEAVARAIAACRVPVISAIGHETDFTIADFVADQRAPTPSAAAEIVICTSQSLLERVAACRSKLVAASRYRLLLAGRELERRGAGRALRTIERRLKGAIQRSDELEDRLLDAAATAIARAKRRRDNLDARLQASDLRLRFARLRHGAELREQQMVKSVENLLARAGARRHSLDLHLRQMSPLTVLERGYAIVSRPGGAILRAAGETGPGEALHVRLHRGEISVEVKS